MDDIVDYSKKLDEETKKTKKFWIIVCVISVLLSFSVGFYISYVFNSSKKDNENMTKLEEIYGILKDDWYYGTEYENIEKTLIDKAIYGMMDLEKDPFTRYLTSLGSLATSYEGLGITISEYKEYFVISDIVSKVNIDSGFKKGDIIKKIDNVSLENKTTDDIKTLIENKESVEIVVERSGLGEITLIGYITTYSPVTVFKDFSNEEMAYIRISEFAMDTAEYLDEYLSEAKQEGYNRLVLDLRDNPGGYISSVVSCADFFMGKEKIVLTTEDKKGNSYSYKTSSDDKYDFDKIVVLINQNSASGAEALSAALNENMGDIVELVGVKTYGKGSAQKTVYFTDGTYFHYTYALWFTPNNNTIQKKGVSPEVAYVGSGIHLLNFNKVELEKTAYGVDVYNLQVIMKTLGYYNGELTSYFDETLETSIKTYQTSIGIAETGKLDKLTIRYILAKYYDDKVADYKNEVLQVIEDYGV